MIAGVGTSRFLYALSGFAFVLLTFGLFWDNEPHNPDWMSLKATYTPQDAVKTPELTSVEHLTHLPALAYAMRAPLPRTTSYVGLALLCAPASPSGVTITASFGPFPQQAQPLQFSVRTGEGQVMRYGPVFTADATSGFHSPHLTARDDVESFLFAALRPDSLISNGHNSFWNRISATDNERVRDAVLACLKNGTR